VVRVTSRKLCTRSTQGEKHIPKTRTHVQGTNPDHFAVLESQRAQQREPGEAEMARPQSHRMSALLTGRSGHLYEDAAIRGSSIQASSQPAALPLRLLPSVYARRNSVCVCTDPAHRNRPLHLTHARPARALTSGSSPRASGPACAARRCAGRSRADRSCGCRETRRRSRWSFRWGWRSWSSRRHWTGA
jgi:hypothetical protein